MRNRPTDWQTLSQLAQDLCLVRLFYLKPTMVVNLPNVYDSMNLQIHGFPTQGDIFQEKYQVPLSPVSTTSGGQLEQFGNARARQLRALPIGSW